MISIDIKVVGASCSNGIKLTKMLKRAIDDADAIVNVEEVNDSKSFQKYGIKNIPGLIINGEVVSQGKVLSVREIYKLLV